MTAPTHNQAVSPPSDLDHCPIMPTYGPPDVMFVRGEGSRLYDPAGKEVWRFIHLRGAKKMSATAKEITAALEKAGAAGS